MKTINDIQETYQEVSAISILDKAVRKDSGLTILDVMIMKVAYDNQDFIRKTEIERILGSSPSMTQKSTKNLRKEGYIIKDRDVDDEGIVIVGMNDEMREQAKLVFERVEEIQKGINDEQNEANNQKEKTNQEEAEKPQNENEESEQETSDK